MKMLTDDEQSVLYDTAWQNGFRHDDDDGNTYYLSGVNIMKQTPDGTQTVLVARPFLLNLFQTRGLLWAFGFLALVTLLVLQEYFIEGRGIGMLDILAIKANVYQLERQGKRLPVYRYLREVWQKEPPSEGLTVLALQQMVDYVEYVDDLTVLGEPWEAENEYDLYQDFLLDVISWGLQKYRAKKRFLWQICYYVNAWATFYYIFGREITQDNVEQWTKTLFEEAKERYPDSLLFEFIPHAAQLDYVWFYRLTDEQRLQIRLEVGEWNLQKNNMDQAVQSYFDDAMTWHRDNGRKLLEAKTRRIIEGGHPMSKQNPKEQSLCNNKFDGLMNAAPHKRYKSFAVTVADWESVWLDCDPNQPLPDEGVISVWQEEMFAAAVCTDKPFFKMDVHDFCDLLGAHPDATIRVFPNGKNWTDMAAEDLLEDVLEELDRVE